MDNYTIFVTDTTLWNFFNASKNKGIFCLFMNF